MRVGGTVVRLRAVIDGVKIEPGPIKASEAEKILAWTGYKNVREWEIRASDGDPEACRALLALVEFRKGNHVRIADLDIDDVDAIEADLFDELGRVLSWQLDEDGDPVLVKGQPVPLLDGEPLDPPLPQESPTT